MPPYTGSDRPATLSSTTPSSRRLDSDVAWELDFLGWLAEHEVRHGQLLATDEARYVVMATLHTLQIADAYLTLGLWTSRWKSPADRRVRVRSFVDLVQARLDGGIAGVLDLRQAQTLLYGATKAIPDIQRQIERRENFISILLGQNPGPIKHEHPVERPIPAPALPRPPDGPAHAATDIRRPSSNSFRRTRRSASPRRSSIRRSR